METLWHKFPSFITELFFIAATLPRIQYRTISITSSCYVAKLGNFNFLHAASTRI